MFTDDLEICRDFLEKAYHERLGISFSSSIAEIGQGRQPVWRTVSDMDLTTEVENRVPGAAGLLLDPEIGLLSYILPFNNKTSLHKQIVRALGLRSQLSVERNYSGSRPNKGDSRGAWRVAVHWLVRIGSIDEWTSQIEKVRRESAFSEELSLDAIFVTNEDLRTQIARYGFPRLLITTREVFKKQRLDDMMGWLSADELVKDALVDFTAQFHKPEHRELATEVTNAMRDFDLSERTVARGATRTSIPRKIRKIHIRDFRNLRDVRFDFGIPPVSVSVIHGPNGTGKSSLCEAISIALFGSSFRYRSFADSSREKDVTARDRAREYLAKYLTPLDDPKAEPQIALDDQPLTSPNLLGVDETEEADLAATGTILTQDTTIEFARMPSDELGARVLRGYSDLANHVDDFTTSAVDQANEARQRFLRLLGLSTAITKIDTAYERIARREIDQSLPPFPRPLVSWLETATRFTGDASGGLVRRWRSWGEDESRIQIARRIASLNNRPQELSSEISHWLQAFNELVLATEEVVKSIQTRFDRDHDLLEQVGDRINAWGAWMETQGERPKSTSNEASRLAQELHALQVKQQEVQAAGQNVRAHFDHLTKVESYLRESWSRLHANTCPTCGADHSVGGGILNVVETQRMQAESEREQLRREYLSLKSTIEGIQHQLVEFGVGECPLSSEEQSSITISFQWLVGPEESFEESVRTRAQREVLVHNIAVLSQVPSLPAIVAIDPETERFSQNVLSQFREADSTFETPNNWKPVRAKLTEILAGIVKDHLPNTLERLWCELALNLTSAPWLLPDRPCFDVATKRGEQRSTVRVKDRLARYILNQSEVHTLGLAWFFTNYLTRGRFSHACMIMDDPAQELDQTSFRDLCRLWETIVRLHKVYQRPLKLIIMLNQESRAVDAARATGGLLYVLDWARDQERPVRKISVVGGGFFALEPTSLFEKTG